MPSWGLASSEGLSLSGPILRSKPQWQVRDAGIAQAAPKVPPLRHSGRRTSCRVGFFAVLFTLACPLPLCL